MRRIRFAIVLLFLAFATFSLTWATGNNCSRFGIQFVSPTGDLRDIELDEVLEADNALGISFGYEHVFFDKVGIDFNVAYSKHDLKLTEMGETTTIGDIEMMMPFTAGVNFHMVRNTFVDLYIGPFAGYVLFGDINPSGPEESTYSINSDFSVGGVLGFDVAFTGKGFMFTSALKYMKVKAETDVADSEELDIDPWVLQIGLGYRF